MNKSLRSIQEEAPNWTELDRNTLPQLHQILRELGEVPPPNANRAKLLNLIRYRLSPRRASFKGKLPVSPIPREPSAPQLFNVLSDHESSSYSDGETMFSQDFEPPVTAPPSRLFPSDRRSPPLSVRLPVRHPRPARKIAWRAILGVVVLLLVLGMFSSDSCGEGLAKVGDRCVPADRAAEYALALAAAKHAAATNPTIGELARLFEGVNLSLILDEPDFFEVILVDRRFQRA